MILAIQRCVGIPESKRSILLRELEQGVADRERYMLDEKKLQEKYASDQGKLNAIFKNAIKVSCPIKNITLWLDQGLAYTEGHMAQNEEKEETTTVKVNQKTKKTTDTKVGGGNTKNRSSVAAGPRSDQTQAELRYYHESCEAI